MVRSDVHLTTVFNLTSVNVFIGPTKMLKLFLFRHKNDIKKPFRTNWWHFFSNFVILVEQKKFFNIFLKINETREKIGARSLSCPRWRWAHSSVSTILPSFCYLQTNLMKQPAESYKTQRQFCTRNFVFKNAKFTVNSRYRK